MKKFIIIASLYLTMGCSGMMLERTAQNNNLNSSGKPKGSVTINDNFSLKGNKKIKTSTKDMYGSGHSATYSIESFVYSSDDQNKMIVITFESLPSNWFTVTSNLHQGSVLKEERLLFNEKYQCGYFIARNRKDDYVAKILEMTLDGFIADDTEECALVNSCFYKSRENEISKIYMIQRLPEPFRDWAPVSKITGEKWIRVQQFERESADWIK